MAVAVVVPLVRQGTDGGADLRGNSPPFASRGPSGVLVGHLRAPLALLPPRLLLDLAQGGGDGGAT